MQGDDPSFEPAQSIAEAIERIFALTGRGVDSSRGEKRALVALRDALGLDVPRTRTNAVLARHLADALDVDWVQERHASRNKVTLDGLNVLLAAASRSREKGSLRRLQEAAPYTLEGPEWERFRPARSKTEAVTRIAALTHAPREWLGPGGKEHKSVLVNLADRLLPEADLNRSSKTRLAASIARALEVPWVDACESTGETISLIALNTLLAGSERRLGALGTAVADVVMTPADEGHALVAALIAQLAPHWDGRSAARWLVARSLRGAFDNEWQGFYGEERAKQVLVSAFTPRVDPPRTRFGNTSFDYALNFVWDIKVHTERQIPSSGARRGASATLLNDERAVRSCVAEQGLGFLLVNGDAHMDHDGSFVAWQRAFKAEHHRPEPAHSNSGRSRVRKAAFTATSVESFWIPNTEALDASILRGSLTVRPIGRQAPRPGEESGAARADKFELRVTRARSDILLTRRDWPRRATD